MLSPPGVDSQMTTAVLHARRSDGAVSYLCVTRAVTGADPAWGQALRFGDPAMPSYVGISFFRHVR